MCSTNGYRSTGQIDPVSLGDCLAFDSKLDYLACHVLTLLVVSLWEIGVVGGVVLTIRWRCHRAVHAIVVDGGMIAVWTVCRSAVPLEVHYPCCTGPVCGAEGNSHP